MVFSKVHGIQCRAFNHNLFNQYSVCTFKLFPTCSYYKQCCGKLSSTIFVYMCILVKKKIPGSGIARTKIYAFLITLYYKTNETKHGSGNQVCPMPYAQFF